MASFDENTGQKKFLYTADKIIKWYKHFGKEFDFIL